MHSLRGTHSHALVISMLALPKLQQQPSAVKAAAAAGDYRNKPQLHKVLLPQPLPEAGTAPLQTQLYQAGRSSQQEVNASSTEPKYGLHADIDQSRRQKDSSVVHMCQPC